MEFHSIAVPNWLSGMGFIGTWCSNLLMTDGSKAVSRQEKSPVSGSCEKVTLTWGHPQGNMGSSQGADVLETTQLLDEVVAESQTLDAIQKVDVRKGDCLFVTTKNSTYTLWALCDGLFWVWGGWFERQGACPQLVSVNGCTWGGSIIKQDIVAAIGLRMEFGNRVRTTEILDIRMVRAHAGNSLN